MHDLLDLPSTQRLHLQRFTPDDLDLLCGLHADSDVMRYIGGTRDRGQTMELLSGRVLAYYDEHPGLGAWATIERATGDCIGLHLLNHIHGESHIQVGYTLFKRYWGRGYATEMCVALLRYGYTRLQLRTINAIADLPHTASQHVLLKSGLNRNGERSFAHPRYAGGVYAWFERDADDWLEEDRNRERDTAFSRSRTMPA